MYFVAVGSGSGSAHGAGEVVGVGLGLYMTGETLHAESVTARQTFGRGEFVQTQGAFDVLRDLLVHLLEETSVKSC